MSYANCTFTCYFQAVLNQKRLGNTTACDNRRALPDNSGGFLVVQAGALLQGQRQSPQAGPVARVAGVAPQEDVPPRLVVQQPQHPLIFNLEPGMGHTLSRHQALKPITLQPFGS